jgi:hypothetical protein
MSRRILPGIQKSFLVAILIPATFLAATAIAWSALAQQKHAASAVPEKTVDKTKMGPYRALAQLAYSSYQKGDRATAAELCQILERVWDKSEDYGGDTALSKTNPTLFKQIDNAMDAFINPLMNYAKTPPKDAGVKTTYAAYLDKLKQAD